MKDVATSPRCAVVLCTYNGERFLSQQLESLRAQTLQPASYVLSDDASTDGTWALLQAFAADRVDAGCEVILHRNEANLGYVRHFEQALRRANADAVSYTHLDVYKRQAPRCASRMWVSPRTIWRKTNCAH